MILSILICALEERKESLCRVLNELYEQTRGKQIQILVNMDNGRKSTGTKRNKLLQKARGEYVCFVDDDDQVSVSYISDILTALESKPDVVGFGGVVTTIQGWRLLKISKDLPYLTTKDEAGNTIFLRFNTHLSPIKKEIALQIGFPDKYLGEDYDYAKRLHESGLIKTEVYIPKQLYFYHYKSK